MEKVFNPFTENLDLVNQTESGVITGVEAGLGLIGGGTTGDIQLDIDDEWLESGFVQKSGDTMTDDLYGTDFIKTRSGTVNRTGNYISSIIKTSGRTITFTRNASNYITSATDGLYTWTFTRNGSNQLTSWSVTQ